MGELVAWALGMALGFLARDALTSWRRILAFGLAIMVLGALITLMSGEMASEPWLVIIDIGQVAVAALLGAFALPFGFEPTPRHRAVRVPLRGMLSTPPLSHLALASSDFGSRYVAWQNRANGKKLPARRRKRHANG